MAELTADAFIAALWANQSHAELEKIGRYFKSGEGDYGAGDRFIANRFFRHFLRLGLQGGVIGGGIAMLMFGFSESIASWFSGTAVGDQFAALLGTFSLRPSGYLILAAQALVIAAITAAASRRTLFATLNEID